MGQFTVKEAAAILGITPRGVRMRIEEKRIAAVMVGREWLVDLPGVEAIPVDEPAEEVVELSKELPQPPPVPEPASPGSGFLMRTWAAATLGEVARLSRELGAAEKELALLRPTPDGDYTPRRNWLRSLMRL